MIKIRNCKYIKINKNEYIRSKEFIDSSSWASDKTIVTLGSKGCRLKDKIYSVEKVEIKDLCGAGDTFMASLCVKYVETSDIEKSLVFANECATQVVQLKGVNVINEI